MEHIEIVTEVYQLEDDYAEAFGYKCFKSHKLATIDKQGELFLGNERVIDYKKEPKIENLIPIWYCVREKDGGFICGLDLLKDGRVWQGKTNEKHDKVEQALNAIGDFGYICLEESMRL